MRKKPLLALLVLTSLLPILALAAPNEASGTVTNVVDGDTFDLQIEKTDPRIIYEIVRVRLADVDSPEVSTPEGQPAKDYTTEALLGKKVWLDIDDRSGDGRDPYGCILAVVYLVDLNGLVDATPFNRLLVDAGHARVVDSSNNEFDPVAWWTGGAKELETPTAPDIADKPITQLSGSRFSDWLPPNWLQQRLQSTRGLGGLEDWGGHPHGMRQPSDWYVGSVYSNRYHYPDCEWARRIFPGNQIWFSSSREARAAGYVPCEVCRPP